MTAPIGAGVGRVRWGIIAAAVAILAAAALAFQPLAALPFDIWDFREFLPLLRRGGGVVAGWLDLERYYAGQGRHNPLFYFTFAVQYALFGDHPLPWRALRFVVMVIDLGLLALVARRLGAGAWGAVAAVAIFAFGAPAQRGWVQLMAEPLGLLLLLTGVLLAIGYRERPRWGMRAVELALLATAVLLLKEALALLAAAVIVIAWTRADDRWSWPRIDRRTAWLGALALTGAALVGAGIVWVRSWAPPSGYGMAYGQGALVPSRLFEAFLNCILPYQSRPDPWIGIAHPANLAFAALLFFGATSAAERGKGRDALRAGAIGLLPPLLTAVTYWPWPKFDVFYSLPASSGPALLAAAAAVELGRRGGAARAVAVTLVSFTVVAGGLEGARAVRHSDAQLRLEARVVEAIATLPAADTVFLAGRDAAGGGLPVTGEDLRGYVAVLHPERDPAGVAAVVPLGCAEALARAAKGPGRTLLSFSYGCGPVPDTPWRAEEGYRGLRSFDPAQDLQGVVATLGLPRR